MAAASRLGLMKEILRVFVPGKVVAKGRPRFARVGNFVTTYTPADTKNAERIIKMMAAAKLCLRNPSPHPLRLLLTVHLTPPASWPQWKREAALAQRIDPTTKPDLDNVLKLVKDALNKVAWQDDAQVVECEASKVYGDAEGLAITVLERVGSMTAQNARRAA
jgi:Holliday junction resolvase RusA-like endonuclease